jgi:CubicO group peptidase (beta-lactamase class C family)
MGALRHAVPRRRRRGRPAHPARGLGALLDDSDAERLVGYGAGWWINGDDSRGAVFRRKHGMPADAFMAMGIYGQTVVVVPSRRLVIARFGTTYDLMMAMVDICRLTADTIAAL